MDLPTVSKPFAPAHPAAPAARAPRPAGRVRRWGLGLLLAAGLGVVGGSGAQAPSGQAARALPALGDGTGLSLTAERRLGDRIMRQLWRNPLLIDDAVLEDGLQRFWTPLVEAAERRGELPADMRARFAWQIMLVRDPSLNAFALPGGYLGVHLGLMAGVAQREELISVLAHELSHVTQRHIARQFDDQARMAPLLIGSLILGALVAGQSPGAAQALIYGGQAAGAQAQLNYSRDMEREADRIGYAVMREAGFDPQGFASMFERLQQASALNDNGRFPYLRSHPLTTERIADMQQRLGLGAAGWRDREDLLMTLLSARARALAEPSADALARRMREAREAGGHAAQAMGRLYAGALAAALLGEHAQAQAWAQALSDRLAPSAEGARLLRWLQAELALRQRDAATALTLLGPWPVGATVERPTLMLAAQALAQWPEASALPEDALAAVTEGLRERVRTVPQDAAAWLAQAQLERRRGLGLAALRSEGEALMVRMDFEGAVDRYLAAQELGRRQALSAADHILLSIIDVRLRQARAALRELQAER